MASPIVFSLIKKETFSNLFPQIEILANPSNIYIETLCYNIKIPVIEEVSDLNDIDLFEEIILKLFFLKNYSIEELSQILCLEKDFITYVINQLISKELIYENRTLSNSGLKIINEKKMNNTSLKFKLGKIFVLRNKKNNYYILPYVCLNDDFQTENVSEYNSNYLTVDYGSIGRPRPIKGRCVRDPLYVPKDGINVPFPEINSTDIEHTINIFNNICLNRGLTTLSYSNQIPIDCSFDCKVYFHMQAVLQKGFVDEPIFSDGFVPNINEVKFIVKETDSELISKIREKAIDINSEDEEENEKKFTRVEIKGKYWQVKLINKKIKELISQIKELSSSDGANISTELQNKYKNLIINYQRLIEWGLMFYVKINPIKNEYLELLKKQSPENNGDFIFSMMKRSNLLALSKESVEKFHLQAKDIRSFLSENKDINSCDDVYRSMFSHIYKSDIDRFFQFKEPKLYTCIPLVMLEACSNPSSYIYKLQDEIPEYFSIIRDVNFYSRMSRHSLDDTFKENVINYYEKCKKMLMIIIPDLMFDDELMPRALNIDISTSRLKSLVTLEHWMGSQFFNSISESIRNQWIQISPDKTVNELPDSVDFVLILSRILEKSYSDAIISLKTKTEMDKSNSIKKVEEILQSKLPDSIVKVSDDNYQCALNQGKSTLGAEILVILASISDNYVLEFEQNHVIEITDKVMSLRKHGANVALSLEYNELVELRNSVLNITKLVGEKL